MNRIFQFSIIVLVAFLTTGCSVYMAANQPDAKDLSLLSPGQPRGKLITEFGSPVHTEFKDGVRTDIFTFTQGYDTGVKVGRAILHGAADVATLGLWEVVGTPAEGYFNGSKLSAQVSYDANDVVTNVIPLKGAEEIATGTAMGAPTETGSIPAHQTPANLATAQ